MKVIEKKNQNNNSSHSISNILYEIINGCYNIVSVVMKIFVLFLFIIFIWICTHMQEVYEMVFPEARFTGVYTIGIKDSDDFYKLTLEAKGTAILGDENSDKGEGFVWDVKRIQGKTYVILRSQDPLNGNLYLYEDKVYTSEFELRRETDNYQYIVTNKDLYNNILDL